MKLQICALITILFVTPAAASVPVDHQHDFDFEFGSWTATLKWRPPLSQTANWVTYTGTSVVRKVWGGRANLGELEVAGGTNRIEGMSLRIYNRQTRTWSIYFANANPGSLGTVPTVGRFSNGRGEFYDDEQYRGKPVRLRFVFSNLTPTSFDFAQSYSGDGGKTWIANWVAHFTRS